MLIPSGTASVERREPRRATRDGVLVGIVVVGAVLRLATLGSQSYWVDESTTVHEVGLALGQMLHQVRVNESSPPLYFVLAWLWAHVFGTGEVGLRLFSALCGITVVPVIAACGRELFSRRVALMAAALAAINPFLLWYSQEARPYALFLLLCSLALLFWLRTLRTGAGRDAAGWGVCAALAVLTHFFAAFLIAPQALWLLVRHRSRPVVAACAGVSVTQLAVLPLAFKDTHHLLGWISAFPLSVRLQQIPVQFGLGQLYQTSLLDQGLSAAALLAAVVAALIILGSDRPARRGAAHVGALAAVALLVPVGLAVLGRDYVVPRNLIGAAVPVILLVALAGLAPKARLAGALLLLVTIAGFVWADIRTASDPQFQRPPWRPVAQALGPAPVPRAIVATEGNFATEPLSVYLPEASYEPPGPQAVTVRELALVSSDRESLVGRLPAGMRVMSSRLIGQMRVWRIALGGPWLLPPVEIAARGAALLRPVPAGATVLLQQPGTRHLG